MLKLDVIYIFILLFFWLNFKLGLEFFFVYKNIVFFNEVFNINVKENRLFKSYRFIDLEWFLRD